MGQAFSARAHIMRASFLKPNENFNPKLTINTQQVTQNMSNN